MTIVERAQLTLKADGGLGANGRFICIGEGQSYPAAHRGRRRAAHEARAAPLYRGDWGYRPALDGEGDGTAHEWPGDEVPDVVRRRFIQVCSDVAVACTCGAVQILL